MSMYPNNPFNIQTLYRVCLSEDQIVAEHYHRNQRTQAPPSFLFNGYHYTQRTREVLAWVLDQLPNTRIDIDQSTHDKRIIATFADAADATAFRIRWG